MGTSRGIPRETRCLLLPVALALLASPGPRSQAWAQAVCGTTSATPLQIQTAADAVALAAAVNCTDGGTVEAVWSGAIVLDASISIGSGTFLSIAGEDAQAEVRGGSQIRMFSVSSGAGLTLTSLKMSSGSATSGGAVYASMATVTLDGCVFDGNAATAGDGGAVWVEGGDLTIIAGEFSGNSAAGNGGAVVAVDAGLVIVNGTLFDENRAVEGGGLYCGGAENSTVAGASPSCLLTDAVFTSNNASNDIVVDYDDIFVPPWTYLYGGGGAAFYRSVVDMTNSVFDGNFAQLSGGAFYGGTGSDVTIDGCSFHNNTSPGHGGAISASRAALGGNTLLTDNSAGTNGAGVFGWDAEGEIEFNDVICTGSVSKAYGGCLYVSGVGVVNEGTVMRDNLAKYAGCIYAGGESDLEVLGGEFTDCRSTGNGAFMFATDGALVTIKEATVTNSVAERRAGVVYCSGDSNDLGGSKVTIEGGTFSDNRALELGGAIVAWGTTSGGLNPTVVTITGGVFSNNTAKFYGGFIFLEELASLSCTGATIEDHFAGDQGGAIYGREATWVNSSCDLISNRAPQGAAAYLTHTAGGVNFENHLAADNEASGGSVVHATETSMMAKAVSFQAGGDLQEDTSNRAIQLEGGATLVAEDCVFGGWMGDTVIYNLNPANGSLVLDSCDFSESTAVMVVTSPYSDAIVRNAVIDQTTIENAAVSNNTLVLVDRAVDCSESSICGPGECVDSDLGVLCECLEDSDCLDGGGALSITVKTPPAAVTFSPELVYFELMVSAAADGTAPAIWELTHESEELALQVFPSSGVLPPGDNVTVSVTGSALEEDVGGGLVSRFVATSIGSGNSDSAAGVDVDVESVFYLCKVFEYAMPADNGGVTCEQCASIDGAEGVDCSNPGATLASLPVRAGYWRSSRESLAIKSCLHPEACVGATQVSSSDDYCDEGYEGPYCASCSEGYGRGIGSSCHSCEEGKAGWLLFTGALLTLIAAAFILLALVFLIGGLDAIEDARQSLLSTFSESAPETASAAAAAATATTHKGRASRLLPGKYKGRASRLLPGKYNSSSSVASAGTALECPGGVALAFAPAFAPEPGETREGSRDGGASLERGSASTAQRCVNVVVGRSGGRGTGDVVPRGATARYADGTSGGGGGAAHLPGTAAASGVTTAAAAAEDGEKSRTCCGVGHKIKLLASRVPLDKLKILVVVWQILTVFPGITGVEFPPAYSRFLAWVDVVNLDVGSIVSGTCLVPRVSFYHRLLLTTLAPLGLALVLVLTYQMAKRRTGIGSASVILKSAAWSRHVAAGLLLTFLVFTSTSTVVFKTFACDDDAVEGQSFLRADFRLSCNSDTHVWYEVYAGIMMAVYPIGIPLLYAYILWINRESLNPSVKPANVVVETGLDGAPAAPERMVGTHDVACDEGSTAKLEERLRKRRQNPDLVPSMFLWKDFGPDIYYYEVIECGRRILLTGVLIFIAPNTAAQAAMACMFAFASLLGFELLRPHLDNADVWLYRLGCVVIFLSNFLALLIKVDAAGEGNRDGLGGIMIALNVFLILAVVSTSWFSTQQSVDDSRDEENPMALAKNMLTFEQKATFLRRIEREEAARRGGGSGSGSGSGDGSGNGNRNDGGERAATAAATEGTDGVWSASSSSLGAGLLRSAGSSFRGWGFWRGSGATGAVSGASNGIIKGRKQKVSAAIVEELWREDRAVGESKQALHDR
ncbi:unnamed protein product [Pylaiella littoralis]